MKVLIALFGLLVFTSVSAAKPREWKDATVVAITSHTSGAAAMPIGTMVVAVPLSGNTYWIECEGITYALQTNYTGHWPNLTIHGHTKIAVDGRTVHILDEDGKDRKMSVVQKAVKS